MTEPYRPNPYLALSGFDPEQLRGRARRAAQMLAQISQPNEPRAVRVVGLPGIGKSSLLHYLHSIHARFLCSPSEHTKAPLRPLQPAFYREPERLLFMAISLKDRPLEMHPFVYLWQQFQASYLRLRCLVHQSFGRECPDLEMGDTLDRNGAIDRLKEATRTLKEAWLRPVLLLDDYDLAFAEMDWNETSQLSPLRDRVAFIFAGTQPLEVANPKAAGSPFYATMDPGQLGGLGDIDPVEADRAARSLITETDPEAGPPLEGDDVDLILQLAGNHPYLLALAAGDLWDLRQQVGLFTDEARRKPLDDRMRRLFEARLATRFAPSFRAYWDWLVPEEYRPRWQAHRGDRPMPGQLLRRLLEKLAVGEELADSEQDEWDTLWRIGLVVKNEQDRPEIFSRLFARFVAGLGTPVRQAAPQHEALYSRVSYLNKKLALLGGEEVQSVRGKGYRLVARADGDDRGIEDPDALGEVGARIYAFLRRHAGELCTFADLEEAAWSSPIG